MENQCIYMIFIDVTGGDSPSILKYIGLDLKSVDFNEIEDYIYHDDENEEFDADNFYNIYICEFNLKNGGLNLFTNLVGFHYEPCLIEEYKTFKGNYSDFKQYMFDMGYYNNSDDESTSASSEESEEED